MTAKRYLLHSKTVQGKRRLDFLCITPTWLELFTICNWAILRIWLWRFSNPCINVLFAVFHSARNAASLSIILAVILFLKACSVLNVWISCSYLLTWAFRSISSCIIKERYASFPSGPRVVVCPGMLSPWKRRAEFWKILHRKNSASTARTAIMQMCFSFCKTLQFMEKGKLDKPYHAIGLALT